MKSDKKNLLFLIIQKIIFVIVSKIIWCYVYFQANQVTTTNEIDYKKATSIFDFTVKDTYGVDVPLKDYAKGYVTIVLNMASTCGYANIHYAQLTQLDKEYGDSMGIKSIFFSPKTKIYEIK